MRHTFAIVLCAAILSLSGCASIGESLIGAVFSMKRPKSGTSSDQSLSKEQRQILFEEEFRQNMKKYEQDRQRQEYRDKLNRKPAGEWEHSIDGAFPER